MPKNLLEDMVRIKNSRKEIVSERDLDSDVEDKFNSYYKSINKKTKTKDDRPRNSLWFVALISALFLFFALSFLFSSATITINPKQQSVPLNLTITAVKDSTLDTDLPFSLTVISGDDTSVVPAGVETDVSQSAKGTVVIYNTYSAASQILSINTRLEGSNGKIYKTVKQITVPGMKGSTPGSVEVDVYGAEPGDSYNSAPLDFKIFGFKGTPKYTKFYARSTGELTGGMVGKSGTLSDEEKAKAEDNLKASLKDKLYKKISSQIPAGFILFKNAMSLNVDDVNFDTTTSDSQVAITLKGTLYGFIFDESKITKKIVENSIPGYDGSPVSISNMDSLNFNMPNISSASFKDASNIIFNLSGTPNIVWSVDTDKITQDVLGKKKKNFNDILAGYNNIASANLVIRPVWKFSFPDKVQKIKVIVEQPQ